MSPESFEVKLSISHKKEVYEEYQSQIEKKGEKIVNLNRFYELWNCLFPLSVNRPWIDIPGKCAVCLEIDRLRRSTKSEAVLLALKDAHLLHRGGMFNQERARYKERVVEALLDDPRNPSIMSIIIDGMDNNKCRCPYLGRQGSFTNALPQHIIGVKEHGHDAKFYRTFGTVSKGSDLTIYCILRKVEQWKRRNLKYPTKLYIQIDGASDNANIYLLGMLELLVSKKMAKTIILTRLPVGHTHEDIDALFGTIYNAFKYDPVETLSAYKLAIENAFSKLSLTALVEDVYCIPDYKKFIGDIVDPYFANWTKEEETQLQFRFESVEPDIQYFPLGCKTTFKAYSNDMVVEFEIQSPDKCSSPIGQLTGLEPRTSYNTWNPAPYGLNSLPHRQGVEGTHVITKYPVFEKFDFKEFIESSVELISSCIKHIRQEYPENQYPAIRQEWNEWYNKKSPQPSDINVEGYANRILNVEHIANLIFIPLKFDLLNPGPIQNNDWKIDHKYSNLHDPTFKWPDELAAALNSVTYTGNLNPLPPRYISQVDQELKENLLIFKDRTSEFFTYMKTQNNTHLKKIVATQVLFRGEQPSVGQMNKTQLTNKLETWSRQFFASIFRPVGSLHSMFVKKLFEYNNLEGRDEVISNSNKPEIKVNFRPNY